MKVTKPVLRLSICPCGFTVLNDSIGIGHEYTVDIESVRKDGYNFFCGGCQKWIYDITVIDASQTDKEEMAPLPYDLFVAETVN